MGRELRMVAVLVAAGWMALPVAADDGVAACNVLADAEIRKLAGSAVQAWEFEVPRDGSPLGGGGSECAVPGFYLQLDAAPVDQYKARMKIWKNATFEPMSGIGDEAHFYVQGDETVGIYTRAGKRMLVVTRDLKPGETPGSVRSLLESVTKAILAKLK